MRVITIFRFPVHVKLLCDEGLIKKDLAVDDVNHILPKQLAGDKLETSRRVFRIQTLPFLIRPSAKATRLLPTEII